MNKQSQIIITSDIDWYLNNYSSSLPLHSFKIIQNEEKNKNNFKTIHAIMAIKEAYIASSALKYIILCGDKFEIEAQNKLLKVFEEPPVNIVFILITTSRSNLLPTVISRMPCTLVQSPKINRKNYGIYQMGLKEIYSFLKENNRISKNDAKLIVECMLYESFIYNIKLTLKQLELFGQAMKLLELNSKPINILTVLIFSAIYKKN